MVGTSERICRKLRILQLMVAKTCFNIFKLKKIFGGDESSLRNFHSTYKQPPVNNDGWSGEGIYETCEDSFACNLIYFSLVPLPRQQALGKGFLRSSFTSSEIMIAR